MITDHNFVISSVYVVCSLLNVLTLCYQKDNYLFVSLIHVSLLSYSKLSDFIESTLKTVSF